MAAAALAAAAAQKDMGWVKTGKIAKKPKLTDPLQLYSLAEVLSTEGAGAEAVLTCKVVDSFYDKPMNFLPQGGGLSEGETTTVVRNGRRVSRTTRTVRHADGRVETTTEETEGAATGTDALSFGGGGGLLGGGGAFASLGDW